MIALRDGRTGELMEKKVTIGYIYMLMIVVAFFCFMAIWGLCNIEEYWSLNIPKILFPALQGLLAVSLQSSPTRP